jgi:hypothetical protein
MKIIKHWLVKLYQHSQQSPLVSIASGGSGSLSRLIAEGYSPDRILIPHRDGSITLLTNPSGGEVKTVRADVVDSIVCTPVYEGKTDQNPPRVEMLEYIKTAIGEGYQPEHEDAVSDMSVIDGLNDGDLNREFGKCWQWYNMGGGFHETFEEPKQKSFETAARPLIKWLCENVHPHHSVIVTSVNAELLQGEMCFPTTEYLKD